MKLNSEKEIVRIKKMVNSYNTIVNFVWSAICLFPISVFCYTRMNIKWFYIFLAISLLTAFLPKSFFKKIHIGKTIVIYKKIGVSFIKKFTQNGDIINGLIKKKYPEYKVVSKTNSSINKFLQQSYMFEKFHFIVFIFFLSTAIYALIHLYFEWAFIITITNIIYNVYPVLLQQYIRIRLSSLTKEMR